MALFDYTAEEVVARVVYFGPERSGKTTNLQQIYDKLPPGSRGELAIVTTGSGTTRVFDFLPAETRRVRGLRLRVQVCAPEGPASAPGALRAALKGADAAVFVADSRAEAVEADEESLADLQRGLTRKPGDPQAPVVIQYNKRDVSSALPLQQLGQRLNPSGLPSVEAIAAQGIGVEETLRAVVRSCHRALAFVYGETAAAPAPSVPGVAAARQPTHQSLAAKSIPTTPGSADTNRAATLRFTKLEITEKLREAAHSKAPSPKKD